MINSIKTYDEFRKNATGQGDDYTTGCLIENFRRNNFRNNFLIETILEFHKETAKVL